METVVSLNARDENCHPIDLHDHFKSGTLKGTQYNKCIGNGYYLCVIPNSVGKVGDIRLVASAFSTLFTACLFLFTSHRYVIVRVVLFV